MLLRDISPLRFPGSKQELVPYILNVLEYNEIKPDVLVEPFVGGGSVFLNMLANKTIEKAIIADKDPLIYSFLKVLFSDPGCLIGFVRKIQVNLKNFYKYKEISRNYQDYGPVALAKSCIFLNRTSFSGLLTDKVGPLGGKYQKSAYPIDCRFCRDTLAKRILSAATFSEKVIVLQCDWKETVDFALQWKSKRKKPYRLLFYLDPPFYLKAADLYRFHFTEDEHRRLSKNLMSLREDWILSYDNAKTIRTLYSQPGYMRVNIQLPYSLNSHAKRLQKELFITPLKIPRRNSATWR